MSKGKKTALIVVLVAAACVGIFFGWKYLGGRNSAKSGEDVAYVQSIGDIMGMNSGYGLLNRFAGVVESQETWSVNQNPEYTIEKVFVSVGDEVKEGDPLFSYSVEQFESNLTQAEIDMERLQNELEAMLKIRDEIEKAAKKASSSEKANYEIQLQEQDLNIKQKNIDITSKQMEIDKLKENMEHSVVTSGLTGVIKSINTGGSVTYGDDSNNAFITVMQLGDYRVKGTINEQNMWDINVGERVIVFSRMDPNAKWYGMIERVDTENAEKSSSYYYSSDSGMNSSKYPFYVTLDDSTGLMLGQHVYMELDRGQGAEEEEEQLKLYSYMIDMTDPDHPFVWADNNGKLVKKNVTLGEFDEDWMSYGIVDGVSAEDRIAFPEERLKEGMTTADMADMVYEENDYVDGGYEETYDGAFGEGETVFEGGESEEGEGNAYGMILPYLR